MHGLVKTKSQEIPKHITKNSNTRHGSSHRILIFTRKMSRKLVKAELEERSKRSCIVERHPTWQMLNYEERGEHLLPSMEENSESLASVNVLNMV